MSGQLQLTIDKLEPDERVLKFPAGHDAEIVAIVPDFDQQRIKVGREINRHNFRFVGAGDPVVLIVVTKDCEAAAMQAVCDQYSEMSVSHINDSNIYNIGQFVAKKGKAPRKFVMVTSGPGNTGASAVTSQALATYRDIHHILLVGIAGGCPNPAKPAEHVRLGDIVVPDGRGIIEYDYVKQTRSGAQMRSHPQRPGASWLQAAVGLDANSLNGKRPWQKWIARGIRRYKQGGRPDDNADVLHAGGQVVAHPVDPHRQPGQPRVHRGAIGSADILQKNSETRDELRNKFDIRAIEMEGSGVQTAAWMQGKDIMVVRGICDYCDEYKNDDWQPYASIVAAAYSRALIESLPDAWFP